MVYTTWKRLENDSVFWLKNVLGIEYDDFHERGYWKLCKTFILDSKEAKKLTKQKFKEVFYSTLT